MIHPPSCLLCGRPGSLHGHHVLGRGADGAYLGPWLVQLCSGCHQGAEGLHSRLRGLALDSPQAQRWPGPLGRAELGLRRVAVLVDLAGSGWLPVADALAGLADELLGVSV